MLTSAVTLDQLRVFRQVAQSGSFSAAARALHRVQSAVTYAIQNLEEQVGAPLFDRSGYRPVLSEAGQALLPRATRILEELASFNAQARSIAGGLEPEVSLVVDPTFPTPRLVRALADFQQRYPTVLLRVYVETLGAAAQTVLDGTADLGITLEFASEAADLEAAPIGDVELVPVVAPSHPLAAIKGRITVAQLRDHIQLVLSDRSALTRGKDYSVFSVRTWRLADLGARHELLRAGLGWGSMPIHMVEEDLAKRRLVRLDVRRPDGQTKLPRPVVVLARRRGKALGPAGEWLAARIAQQEPATPPASARGGRTRRAHR